MPGSGGTPFARAASIATGHDPRGAARLELGKALGGLIDMDPDASPVPRILVKEHRLNEPLYEGDFRGHGRE